ncbi:AraC family transcriptional regulator [Paenibacillus sp. HB172176]|uniref:helix-turn-helix transcriptional regulator n=1 Tax=Paenibacillus sp. HB172176 TaxID=2493690 RepID=UPI00143B3E30|nr:AraC family transcriptional regulator [Paenibacillus sp. HB172176]
MEDKHKEQPFDTDARKHARFHFDNQYRHDPKVYGPVTLYQIGDLSCAPGYEIGEHVQYCHEISYIASGKGVFTSDSDYFEVKEGDLILHRPGQRHNGIADKADPFRFFYIGFSLEEHAEGAAKDADAFFAMLRMLDQTADPVAANQQPVAAAFVGLFQELMHPSGYAAIMIESYLRQVLVAAYRAFYERWDYDYDPKAKSDHPRQIVYRIIHYIDSRLTEIEELTEIADELNYSYSYLSHIFSRETGRTIKEYYNRKRFELAGEWLRAGQLTVTHIAERLNYHSIHAFSKAFRQHYGMSPTEYQALADNLKK